MVDRTMHDAGEGGLATDRDRADGYEMIDERVLLRTYLFPVVIDNGEPGRYVRRLKFGLHSQFPSQVRTAGRGTGSPTSWVQPPNV